MWIWTLVLYWFCCQWSNVTSFPYHAVATPKQIRELMKVDGLTNDEVKSHLQVRFCSSFPHSVLFCNIDGTCLMNEWFRVMFQKYRLHARRAPNSSVQANQQVLVMGSLWPSQDHYTAVLSQQSASPSGSPQSPLQLADVSRAISVTAGDSYEEEDGKSESYGWKWNWLNLRLIIRCFLLKLIDRVFEWLWIVGVWEFESLLRERLTGGWVSVV